VKIISRNQSMQMARIMAVEMDCCINANELMYEYVSVCNNADVDVGISMIGSPDVYNFTINKEITLTSISELG